MSKIAVVLFNLGGPDSLRAVWPFLFNLFNDRAVIALPQPWRAALAAFIATKRGNTARMIYRRLGGGTPLVANTEVQARALEKELGPEHRVFIAMRHWHPRSAAAAAAIKAWGADEIVLLPLYPQFSTTTTGSSLAEWRHVAAAAGLAQPARALCCYPAETGFIAALAAEIRRALSQAPAGSHPRVLFSAHGLPEKIIAGGDPYQWQVEHTAAALRAALDLPGLDSVVCYQSRVGPLAWLGPATDAEIRRAGAERRPLIVVPIAFVSEHSETLVELDMDYRDVAEAAGVPSYVRVATVGAAPDFIAGLASLVRRARRNEAAGPAPASGRRLCPQNFAGCACGTGGSAA